MPFFILNANNNSSSNLNNSVIAVYGVDTDDYLLDKDKLKSSPKTQKVYSNNQSRLNLPDAFYFIGGPIFLYILLKVITIFIKIFEDEREHELKIQRLEKRKKNQSKIKE